MCSGKKKDTGSECYANLLKLDISIIVQIYFGRKMNKFSSQYIFIPVRGNSYVKSGEIVFDW